MHNRVDYATRNVLKKRFSHRKQCLQLLRYLTSRLIFDY